MGNDAPLSCLTMHPQLVFDYFKQLFAQVCCNKFEIFLSEVIISSLSSQRKHANIYVFVMVKLCYPFSTTVCLTVHKKIRVFKYIDAQQMDCRFSVKICFRLELSNLL